MAVITTHARIDTLLFEDLAQIGNGSDHATFSLSGPADPTPDSVEYFHTARPLHIVLHEADSDLVIAAARPITMTVTSGS